MAMSTEERTDLTPRPQRQSNLIVSHRPGSPLKQEVLASPVVESSPPSPTPTVSRGGRTYETTHRWTVLAREAEADEVSILSINSEDRGYYASLFDGTLPDEPAENVTVLEPIIVEERRASSQFGFVEETHARTNSQFSINGKRASSRFGSVSGFSEGVWVEDENGEQYMREDKRE